MYAPVLCALQEMMYVRIVMSALNRCYGLLQTREGNFVVLRCHPSRSIECSIFPSSGSTNQQIIFTFYTLRKVVSVSTTDDFPTTMNQRPIQPLETHLPAAPEVFYCSLKGSESLDPPSPSTKGERKEVFIAISQVFTKIYDVTTCRQSSQWQIRKQQRRPS